MVLGNIGGGMAASFSILAILAIANAITTWVSPSKQTLSEMIESKTGLNTSGM
jgi:hypothetical protein